MGSLSWELPEGPQDGLSGKSEAPAAQRYPRFCDTQADERAAFRQQSHGSVTELRTRQEAGLRAAPQHAAS